MKVHADLASSQPILLVGLNQNFYTLQEMNMTSEYNGSLLVYGGRVMRTDSWEYRKMVGKWRLAFASSMSAYSTTCWNVS